MSTMQKGSFGLQCTLEEELMTAGMNLVSCAEQIDQNEKDVCKVMATLSPCLEGIVDE